MLSFLFLFFVVLQPSYIRAHDTRTSFEYVSCFIGLVVLACAEEAPLIAQLRGGRTLMISDSELTMFRKRILLASVTAVEQPRWTPKSGHQWTPENRPPRRRG